MNITEGSVALSFIYRGVSNRPAASITDKQTTFLNSAPVCFISRLSLQKPNRAAWKYWS